MCLGSSTGMSVIFFRCIEAMYGTSPDSAELSVSNYCSYYQSMVPFVWDAKTKRIQKIGAKELLRKFLERLFQLFALSLFLSMMIHHNYKPFDGDAVGFTNFSVTPDLLSPGHLLNSYLMTCKKLKQFVRVKQPWNYSHSSIDLFVPSSVSSVVLFGSQ